MKYRLLLLLFFALQYNLFYSQDPSYFQSQVASGDWDSPTTWLMTSGSDADNVPDLDDTVEIQIGHIIQASSVGNTRICKFIIEGELALDNTYSLYVYGFNTTSTNNGVISGAGNYYQVRSGSLDGSGTIPLANLNVISAASLEISCDLIINGETSLSSSGKIKINSGYTFTVNGLVKASSGSTFTNEGTLNVNTASFLKINVPSSTCFFSGLGNIVWNNTSDFPIPAAANEYKNVTINSSTSVDGDITVLEDWTNNATFSSIGSGNTITFNGSSTQTISGSGTNNFKNLTLNNSTGLLLSTSVLNIEEVFDLSSGNFNNVSGTVVLESDADNTAGQLNLGSSSYFGNLTVERYIPTSSQGYRMFGSPVMLTQLINWQDDAVIFSGFSGSDYPTFGWINSYTYDESAATDANKEAGWEEANTINDFTIPSSGTWIYTDASTYKLSVSGTPYTGDQDITITKGGSTDQRGWNLITNPYPCNLDWDLFHADNSSIVDDAYWIYDADVGNNVFYSGAGGGTLSNIISHSQGIWVHKTSVGSTDITFQQSHLSPNSTTYVKSSNGINIPLKIKISGDVNGYHDFSFIKAVSNASSNFDQGLDVVKSFSPLPDLAPNVFPISSDGYSLGANLINNNQSLDIPIGVKIGSAAPGNYTIDFFDLAQFMIGSCITLEDLHTGAISDLRIDSSYTFVSDTLSPSPRFILHINVDYDINVTNSTCFNDNSALFTLSGNGISGSYFNVYNENGILIDSLEASSDSISFLNMNAGIYSLQTNHIGTCTMINQNIIITEQEEVIADFSFPLDTVVLDFSNEVYFSNHSLGSNSYLWDFGDGNYSVDENPIYTYDIAGTYTITLTADNDSIGLCTNVFTDNIFVQDDLLNLNDANYNDDFNIYISNSTLHIDLNSKDEQFNYVLISDLTGRVVKLSDFKSSINVDFLNHGVYIISLLNNKNNLSISKKVVY